MWLPNHYHHPLLGTHQAASRTLHMVCDSLIQKDTDNLECTQHRAVKMIWSCIPCLWGQTEGLELVQPAGEPYNSPSYLWGGYEEERDRFLIVKPGGRIRDDRHILKQERFRLDMRPNFFTFKQWNRLPRHTVQPWRFSRPDQPGLNW